MMKDFFNGLVSARMMELDSSRLSLRLARLSALLSKR